MSRGARPCCADLVAIYDAGMREPLPLPLQVRPRVGTEAPLAPRWPGSRPRSTSGRPATYPGEDADPEQVAVWGPGRTLATLLATKPRRRRGDRGRDHAPGRAGPPALGADDRRGCTDERPRSSPFDLLARAADRHGRARGQRRHRQDLHDRGAGGPLRRRGGGQPRRDAGDHLRPDGQPGAARARTQPARRRRARPGRPRGRRRRRVPAVPVRGRRRRADDAPQADRRRAGRLRRGHDRHHPPVLPARAALARHRGRHRRAAPPWSRTSTSSWSRWSTTSTCASTATAAEKPPFDRGTALRLARAAVGDPQADPGAARTPTPSPARAAAASGSPSWSAPRWTGASAGSASSATTTCSAGSPHALEPDDAPARERMRQPLADRARRRVPGHRPGAVGRPRPSLPRPLDPRADRRPQAGHLRLPRRRHLHLPRGAQEGRHHPRR